MSGTRLVMLVSGSTDQRSAAAIIARRLAGVGVTVSLKVAPVSTYATLLATRGWDLALALRPVRYPAPRSLLAPLLDPSWPAADTVAVVRTPALRAQLLLAAGESQTSPAVSAWQALESTLQAQANVIALAQLDVGYPRGPNVFAAPTIPTLDNADPANVSLGSTRPAEPQRSATPTP